MRTINHNLKPGLIVLILMLACFVALMLFGCNPAAKLARKDEAAVNRVNGNIHLQEQVINPWLKAHPPIEGKETIKYLPGEIQYKERTVKDQKEIDRIKDSTVNAMGDSCKEFSLTAYNLGYEQAELYFKKNPFVRVDIKEISTPDLREANRWKDSTNFYKNLYNYNKGQLQTTTEQLSETKRKNTNMWWLVVAISVGAVLSHVARSYFPKIKIPKL